MADRLPASGLGMYESFFAFEYRPFVFLPGVEDVVWTNGHRNALSVIEFGLDRLSQVTVLTGASGTGKTTLIRRLMRAAGPDHVIGLASGVAGGRGDLLQRVLTAFGLDVSPASEADLKRRLMRHLVDQLAQGRRCVLVIDEAQNLSPGDLETLRRLGHMDTADILLLLVLVGRPELRTGLKRNDNRRICQVIGADYHLEPMTPDETGRYVRDKLAQAGGSEDLFDAEALREVHRLSGGVPLKVDELCDGALIAACAQGISQVSRSILRSAAEDALRYETRRGAAERAISGEHAAAAQDPAGAAGSGVSPAPKRPRRRALAFTAGPGLPDEPPADGPELEGGNSDAGTEHPDIPPEIFGFSSWSDDIWDFVEDPDDPSSRLAADKLDEDAAQETEARSRPALRIPLPLPRPGRHDAALTGSATVHAVSRAYERRAARSAIQFDPAVRPPAGKPVRWAARRAAPAAAPVEEADRVASATPPEADPAPQDAGLSARAASAGDMDAEPAIGAGEAALRRAYARSGGRRWRWRRAASLAALAAGGSIAAAVAVGLLHGQDPEPAERAKQAMRWSGAPAGPLSLAQPPVAPGPATSGGIRGEAVIGAAESMGPPSSDRARAVIEPPRIEAAARLQAASPGEIAPDGSEAEALFLRALELAMEDPRSAAIGYARAALAGHARAAYYLGQIYESGDGVPVDFALAAYWYEVASAEISRAERRLAQLPAGEGGALAPPLPLLAQRGNGGHADFVWTSGFGADPVSYVVELSADPLAGARTAYQVSGSAARLPLAPTTSHWRVLAVAANGERSSVSGWQRIAGNVVVPTVTAEPGKRALPRPSRTDVVLQPVAAEEALAVPDEPR